MFVLIISLFIVLFTYTHARTHSRTQHARTHTELSMAIKEPSSDKRQVSVSSTTLTYYEFSQLPADTIKYMMKYCIHFAFNVTFSTQQLRETYDKDAVINGGAPLLLTAAVSAGKYFIDTAYDIPQISS